MFLFLNSYQFPLQYDVCIGKLVQLFTFKYHSSKVQKTLKHSIFQQHNKAKTKKKNLIKI